MLSNLPQGTVTLLFTNIEGSTKLLQRLGDSYELVLSAHRTLLRANIESWGGREVDNQGDAFFVAFARASDGVSMAIETQKTLAAHPWPDGAQVLLRRLCTPASRKSMLLAMLE